MRRTQAPILPVQRGAGRDGKPPAEPVDACVLALATTAADAVAAGIARGEDPAAAIASVLVLIFGDHRDRVADPHDTGRDRWLVADPGVVERIVATVIDGRDDSGG